MQSSKIREIFLDYFSSKDHLVMPSFSLIPQSDPTLLLIGAGMAPLKPYFTGEKKPPHPRVATCQKCLRTPDIDRVGHTGRHATFFEMLGNFSFGDYFKEEAISWAWDLVLNGYRLPVDRLWVSIYEEDEEAYKIWNERIGVPTDRIVRLGKEDNFWEIGLGPCGPCSEIYYDLGEEVGCDRPDCAVGCDCDRFLEIWNLVFTQFNREPNGELTELEHKNIDTGAGLERMAIAMQGVHSIYETDCVKPLYNHFSNLVVAGKRGEEVPLRIVTEHSRGTAFLISDGVLPSNEGRGYVLRRLLRRAIRFGKLLGIEGNFMTDAVTLVTDLMGSTYPELKERQDYIRQIVKVEEEKFQETLAQGTEILNNYIEKMRRNGQKILPGEQAFKLYDTYGFPLDLTAEILEEEGLEIDGASFEQNLREQQERARAAAHSSVDREKASRYRAAENLNTIFTGYEMLRNEASVLLLLVAGEERKAAKQGETVEILLDRTPFYAEAGGQVGDRGTIEGQRGRIIVEDTVFAPGGQIVQRGKVEEGEIDAGETVLAAVDNGRRQGSCRSHSSTHLLHRALRNTLGDHVNQAGSLVAADRLRFDFNHFSALTEEELLTVEEEVNRMIMANVEVKATVTNLEEAKKAGATALFTEKYDQKEVRMVSAGEYTRELCGGTHVSATGDIGLFKIVSEEGIGSGLRRIEAVAGMKAYQWTVEKDKLLRLIADDLNSSFKLLEEKFAEHMNEYKQLQKNEQEMKQRLASMEAASLLSSVKEVEGVKVLSAPVQVESADALRLAVDEIRNRLDSAVIILGAVSNGKVILVGSVSPELVKRGLNAGRIIKEVAKMVGGGGGGKPELAQAGGKNPAALPEALQVVEDLVRAQLK
ncbi:MAG: alanine--tRNA ligase [Firmicutes bacterium ML8_F2]|jgi:alanyl-tRNA synthetase|nr:MAG: alanine--tRNA ligase [Firmicutes bacterium ML8_F2]